MKFLSLLKKSKTGSSIDYQIKPRKVKFEWQQTPCRLDSQSAFGQLFRQ